MENIEVELRSFISKEDFEKLLDFFDKEAKFLSEDYQETFYFDCEEDLRIQRNDKFAKVWLKKGELHDEYREEIEIKFSKDDFEKLESLFLTLGYDVEIKWFRKRKTYDWHGISVMMDYTRGYGYIIELEIMSSSEKRDENLGLLKKKFEDLKIIITSKEEFKEKFEYYKNNWKNLT
jgi:predicted adenylyl cyclase CyaB